MYTAPWIKSKVSVKKPNFMKGDCTLEISVEIEPNALHPEVAKSNVRRVRRAFNETEMVVTTNKVDLFLSLFLGMASILSQHLFEVDPRIGLPLSGKRKVSPPFIRGVETFPMSPLFDPPRKNLKTERNLYDQGRWTPICPFCGNNKEILLPEEGVFYWGGGNIHWVHSMCAPWIQPTETLPFKGNYGSD